MHASSPPAPVMATPWKRRRLMELHPSIVFGGDRSRCADWNKPCSIDPWHGARSALRSA